MHHWLHAIAPHPRPTWCFPWFATVATPRASKSAVHSARAAPILSRQPSTTHGRIQMDWWFIHVYTCLIMFIHVYTW
jgi:hypothetical protein